MSAIKAVIFDWGGVLIDNPFSGLVAYCSEALSVPPDRFAEVREAHYPAFLKGLVSEKEFWRRVCGDLQVPPPSAPSLWGEAFREVYVPRKEMFDLVALLKKSGYRTALLSNAEEPAAQYFHECNYPMFDVLTFSCREKTAKPEPEIYELTLRRLDVAPAEALMIDDREDYLDGAWDVGIRALLFTSAEDVIASLKSCLNTAGNSPD
ncbi:MAG: HAD family phosphatase [Deltaproteobacteria bacterium]|nr:HAD family phosphatase [Deltaproteobacteria bacterium]